MLELVYKMVNLGWRDNKANVIKRVMLTCSMLEAIKLFSFSLKLSCLKIKNALALKLFILLDVVFILLINVKMPTIVGTLKFWAK